MLTDRKPENLKKTTYVLKWVKTKKELLDLRTLEYQFISSPKIVHNNWQKMYFFYKIQFQLFYLIYFNGVIVRHIYDYRIVKVDI